MKRKILVSIICCICLATCKRQTEAINRLDTSNSDRDTIIKMIEKLCGSWDPPPDFKHEFESSGIMFAYIDFMCLVNIDNGQLINQIYVDRNLWFEESEPENLDRFTFPTSDSVTILKKGQYYGLKYHDQETISFIPIKKLTDSLLVVADGRTYRKKD